MPKKVLAYLRDPRSTLNTACADPQLFHVKAFIKKNGWNLELTCLDEDIGEVVFTAQPGVHKLLEEADIGSIDIVLCHTLDRLCSRFAVAERLLHDLDTKGVEVWAADPGVRIKAADLFDYYYNDPDGTLGRVRRRSPMPDDLYEAEHLVPLPYGYRYTGAYNADGTYIFGFRALEHETAAVVVRIFQMYADGMSPAKIADALNAESIPSPHGRMWRDATIRGGRNRRTGILNDEIYIGRSWVPGREYDFSPALRIVSDELWRRVKRRQDFACRRAGAST
ncbi:recombinase family protein [Rhizobium sp. CSW-27]|uniref:recombinase family protein n=1 Tax=Rhizobium sp. CSW-27 TaxID=2839985 RepID=UPI001C015DA7|nr:recombinase family protein [Rhizobium sp. CSW-27]MBT9373437.1 recombinase family protein [Rhizobium sp. CSW-27]